MTNAPMEGACVSNPAVPNAVSAGDKAPRKVYSGARMHFHNQ